MANAIFSFVASVILCFHFSLCVHISAAILVKAERKKYEKETEKYYSSLEKLLNMSAKKKEPQLQEVLTPACLDPLLRSPVPPSPDSSETR